MTINNNFLKLLQEKGAREGRRISYKDVKEVTGIAESTLSAWANNQISKFDVDTIEKLCNYFNCTPGDLITKQE